MRRRSSRTAALLVRIGKLPEEQLEQLFRPGHVVVSLGHDVAVQPQAQFALSFSVNLLARLYPVVQRLEVVVPADVPLVAPIPRWRASTVTAHVQSFFDALRPDVRCTITRAPSATPACYVAFGSSDFDGPTVFTGSNGWEASVSPNECLPTGASVNPVGAYASACLGVSEVWKRLLYPHRALFDGILIIPVERRLTLSTFTFRTGDAEPNPELPEMVDIGRLTVVGLGAGGGASAFTLASLPALRGTVIAIDPDEIVETNLNRYVFADGIDADASRPKTEVVKALLEERRRRLIVSSLPIAFDHARHELSADDYRYVLAAVHSRTARRDIQLETPKVLWDAAASEDGEFRIWRMVLGVSECMHCKHPDTIEDPELAKARQLASLLGLDVEAWLRKVRSNEMFREGEVTLLRDRILEAGLDVDVPRVGQRFGDWEADNCGRLRLAETDDEIPIPFAPVMAGVLLAGEVIKEHYFPKDGARLLLLEHAYREVPCQGYSGETHA